MNYQLQEGLLPVPQHWNDETVNVFASNDTDGFNLVVTRVDVPTGMQPEAFYQQTFQQFADQLPKYQDIVEGELAIANIPAPYRHYKWQSTEGAMHQVAVLYVHPETRRMMVFTFSATTEISTTQRENLLTYITGFKPLQ